jgi:hypothetical protein
LWKSAGSFAIFNLVKIGNEFGLLCLELKGRGLFNAMSFHNVSIERIITCYNKAKLIKELKDKSSKCLLINQMIPKLLELNRKSEDNYVLIIFERNF